MDVPTLYIFVGYPGAGKTTIARKIAEKTGAVHLWADRERHKMFGEEPTHSPVESRALYNHLNMITEQLLSEGKSVIYDTNFNFRKDRSLMQEIATRQGAEVKLIWITTPLAVARKRATEESEGKDTRVWGNMPSFAFDRMSGNLQPPQADEHAIQIDGTHVQESDIISIVEQ